MENIKNIMVQKFSWIFIISVFIFGGIIGCIFQNALTSYANSNNVNSNIESVIEKSKKDYNIELMGLVNFIDMKDKHGKISVEGGMEYRFDTRKDLASGELTPNIGQTVKFNVKHLKSRDVTNVRIVNTEPIGPFSMAVNLDGSHTLSWSVPDITRGMISYVNSMGLQTYDIGTMIPSGALTINSTDIALDGCYVLKTYDVLGNSTTYGVCSSL